MSEVSIVNKSPYPLPEYATAGSAGLDLRAHLLQPLVLRSMERSLVPTGLYIALPPGFEAQLRPRSGIALRKGISLPNTPGTIDSDYRGEIKVLVINLSEQEQVIEPGERIAQMVVTRYERITWNPCETLDDTDRSVGGFGSTGIR